MNNEVNVVGMTFVNKDPIFKTLRPSGYARLVHDPDNKYDPNAIEVWVLTDKEASVRIGFLPAKDGGDILQAEVIERLRSGEDVCALVLGYSYYANKSFNENHEGRLQSCTLFVADSRAKAEAGKEAYDERKVVREQKELGLEEDDGSDVQVTSTHYIVDGSKYRRLTDLLGVYEPDGKGGQEHLDKWKFMQAAIGFDFDKATSENVKENAKALYECYLKAFEKTGTDGTALHSAIEAWLKGNNKSPVPQGFLNWFNKYEPEIIAIEQTVYDESSMVAGTFDLLCRIDDKVVAVDWKSSKAVRKKHKTQAGWYAYYAEADEGWVVCFGGTQKQGYGLSIVDNDTCAKKADQVDLMVQLQSLE